MSLESNGRLTEGTAGEEGDDRAKNILVGVVEKLMEVGIGFADDRGDDTRVV